MATKLKNLKITSVDFVDEGANPDADIMLFKRKDGTPEPSAAAADDLDKDTRSFIKRLMDAFRSTFASMEPEGEEQVGKSATSFGEEYMIQNMSKIADDMWSITYALYSSLCSILYDEDMDAAQKQSAMTDSVGDFNSVVKQAIEVWTTGEPYGIVLKSDDEPVSDSLISAMKSARDRLSASIEKAAQQSKGTPTNDTTPKGEESDMKFDKSKMTPAERAMLEQFEKNYGMEDAAPTADVPAAAPAAEPAVNKSNTPTAPAAQTTPAETPAADDLFKGLSPEMKAEFEALRKFREDTEDSQLHAVAKSYEIIGKKDEELFPILKSLKKTDQAAYDQMIAALDSAKAAVEKSGVFSEIGKSGTGAPAQGGAVKEAETKAAELMKSKSGLTWAQALDEVLQGDPELAKRYEKEE